MRFFAVLALSFALSACALRPQYRAFVTEPKGPPVKLIVLERLNDKPVAGAKVELGEQKTRQSVTSAADGTVVLQADKRTYDDNPVLVVTMPEGQDGYRLKLLSEYKRRCGQDSDCGSGQRCEATVCVNAPPPLEAKAEAPAPAPVETPAPAPAAPVAP